MPELISLGGQWMTKAEYQRKTGKVADMKYETQTDQQKLAVRLGESPETAIPIDPNTGRPIIEKTLIGDLVTEKVFVKKPVEQAVEDAAPATVPTDTDPAPAAEAKRGPGRPKKEVSQ